MKQAYGKVGQIAFENAYYRRDIGKRALAEIRRKGN